MPEQSGQHVGIRVPFNSEADYAAAQSLLKAKVDAEGLIQTGPGRATLEVECYETHDGRREWRNMLVMQWEVSDA